MGWFNYYGLGIIVAILIPNIVYAITHKDGFGNTYQNKAAIVLEGISRYACMVFMVFNIPYTYFNFYFAHGLLIYIIVNALLCLAYILGWVIMWKKNGIAKALLLSILPSLIFIFSGVILANIPLIVFAIIFSACHILISYKNAK